MAIKKKIKTSTKRKKAKISVKSVKKVKVQKKVQKKKQVRKKKSIKEKTKKISKPAKKIVQKKIKGRGTKTKIKPKVRPPEPKKKKPSRVTKTRGKRILPKIVSESTRTKTSKEPTRQEILRKLLIKKREEIVREAKAEIANQIKGEPRQLVETALDDGDWSVIDLSADISLRRLETHRESLLAIDEALMKLREGTYGVCEDCGGEISAERLKVMPFAIYCKDCREKREELEKATREETL